MKFMLTSQSNLKRRTGMRPSRVSKKQGDCRHLFANDLIGITGEKRNMADSARRPCPSLCADGTGGGHSDSS